MSKLIPTWQVAKQFGVSVGDVEKLVSQEILHPKKQTGGNYLFSAEDVAQISSNKSATLSDAAAQVNIQIEREVVTTVSALQKLGKKITVLSLLTLFSLFLSIITIALFFKLSPQETSDFFGYYYRFNNTNSGGEVLGSSTDSQDSGSVLQASTGPETVAIRTSVLADVLKPVAAASLVVVKAVDNQTYEQIVTNPILSEGIQGPPGVQGLPGINGEDGQDGLPGLTGPQGLAGLNGTNGANGSDGADGSDGSNGTSAVDVMTTAGDVIVRNANNSTARLAAGLDGQVLTITSGIPSWEDSSGGGTIDASLINGATLGITTATSGNLLIGSGTQWVTQAMSGEATIDGAGALTINYASAQSADATHKGFLTALDWNTFNSKQAALGYTAENAANRSTSTSLGTSDTLYPSQNAVKTYIDNNALGLNWKTSLQAVNVIANSASPIGSPVEGDAYIIDTGGDTGTWASFSPGDIVQFQTGVWVKIKSLIIGDRFGVALKTITTPSGTFTGFNNYVFEVTGGTSGAFTYTGIAPSNGDARYVSNASSYYHGISFTYSGSLGEWVQLSSTVNLSYGSGLQNVSNVISLGDLTSDWNQAGLFAINTAGNISTTGTGTITSAGLLTASNGLSLAGNITSLSDISFSLGNTSSSEKVQIGNSATATPDLLVLDNGTADPAGTNGASYYNTSTNKFRCYENSAWKDCDASGLDNIKTSQSNTLASLGTTETSYLSVTITPTSASKNIWVTADATVINNSNNVMITFRIRRGSDCTGTQVGSDVNAGSVKNAILPGTTGVMNFIDSPNTTSATTYQLCALATNNVGATSDGMGGRQITAAEVKLGADLAEAYNSLDTTLVPAEIVAVDTALDGGAKRSEKAYQNDLLGVISTNPGMVLSGPSGPGKPILVALSGRVPVKVNTENGAINAGDYLTSSSTPGVAMKATKAGAIIGTAMNSFDGQGEGQVIVFIKNGFSMGSESDNGSNTASTSAQPTENIIDQVYKSITDLFKNTVEFFGKVIFHSDVSFLGRPTFSSDSGGFAQIQAGAVEVTVNFDQEYETTPIVTASPDTALIYAVSDVNTKGFKIKLSQVEAYDIGFAWTATAIKNAKTFVGTPELSPSPSPSPLPSPEPTPLLDASPSATATQSSTPTP